MGTPPIKTNRLGNVEVAIWKGEFGFSFKFQKSYKGKDGAWKNTDFFSEADLASLSALTTALATKAVKEKTKEAKGSYGPKEVAAAIEPAFDNGDDNPFA